MILALELLGLWLLAGVVFVGIYNAVKHTVIHRAAS